MGSRYGGLKQMDAIGPYGEAIIDYSIYDAVKAGFGKVVFVIRKSFAREFIDNFESKLSGKIETAYVFQELDDIPGQASISGYRTKPWGTGHAVWVARNHIHEPFAVINADDYYGSSSYLSMAKYLHKISTMQPAHYSMVGYSLHNTLSPYGYVSRGICEVDKENFLKSVVERTHIEKINRRILAKTETGGELKLSGKEIVSMNFWGFTPSFFKHLETAFQQFIRRNINDLTAEFYIPTVVNDLIAQQKIKLKVLISKENWFGVTYQKDKESAVKNIQNLIDKAVYPGRLWKS